MEIDTNLGYNYWLNIVASIMDNPFDSIHAWDKTVKAVAQAFNEDELSVFGQSVNLLLEEPKEGKWEIVS